MTSADIINRKRSVDTEQLSEEQLEVVISEISKKIVSLVDGVVEEANQMLGIYGLQTKMQITIDKKE